MQDLAAALQRVETVLQRRPDQGLHDDAPATARWQGGVRVESSHANGTRLLTDMPCELGGSGDKVTPGWMFRAGIAACATTSIAMGAAGEGIALDLLEVSVGSRSDTRGLVGVAEADGRAVYAGPRDMRLQVRIAAEGVAHERLRALVEVALARSPIPAAVQNPTPLALQIEFP
ncbi:hypothetical protein GCM10023165_38900 [Variovorax defluvii]|uniref:OsmC family peroxiredoxin n=2 Tax=Variovorax defluvii TaxID=913761 RepID=A0ABP8I4B5_9BURK